MEELDDPLRRALLGGTGAALVLAPALLLTRGARGADLPLISEQDPAAKAVHYVEDASRAKGATSGATCASCSIFSAQGGAAVGTCTLFPGKLVKAAGWCNAWSSL
jgi:High potential iron-sulfur protein